MWQIIARVKRSGDKSGRLAAVKVGRVFTNIENAESLRSLLKQHGPGALIKPGDEIVAYEITEVSK